MSKNNNVAVEESAAIKRIKQKNMLKKQRLAIVFMVIAIVALVAALIVVDYLVDIYTFEDVDGTAYYVKKNGEVYALYDKDGVACEKNQDGYFETALGTMVSVNAETGECKIYAFVHTSDTEVRDFGEYVLMYKQMTYDHGSTKDNSKIIKSIEVHNEHGTYTFERDSKMNFVIKDMPGAPYNRESFAQLAVACGYTLSTRRLENPKKLENGSVDYAEYGLVSEVRTKTEIDKEGNETEVEYQYEPAWFVITSMTGESHKVIIGDKTVTGTGYYARYDGRDTVYVLGTNGFDGYLLNTLESYITPTIVYPMRSVDYFNVRNFMIYGSIDYNKIYSTLYEKYGEVDIENLDEETQKKFNADYAKLFEQNSRKMCDFSYLDTSDRQGTLYAHSPYVNHLDYADGYNLNSSSLDIVLSSFYETDFTSVIKLSPSADDLSQYGLVNSEFVVMFYYETTDSEGETVYAENFVQISDKTEEGIYYAYSETYDMIVGVKADCFEFLEWEEIKWYETSYIQYDISFVEKIQIESPAFKVDFEIEDSASKYMTYLQRSGNTIGEYSITKDALTGKYVLTKNGKSIPEIYRGDYLIMPTVYSMGQAEEENYLFAESREFDSNGDGQNDGVMYYFYNIAYNKDIQGYGLMAQVVCSDYEGNRLAEDSLVWGHVAMKSEFFATNNGYMFFVSKESQSGAQIDKIYGEKNRGAWGNGNLFITSDNKYILINAKTGAWMTVKDYAQGIYFADRETSRLAERAITIPALYEDGKLKRYEETFYPTTDKKLLYNDETNKIMAYNKLSGAFEDITYADCSIGVWNAGAYYVLDDGKLVVVNEVTGEWGYLSVLNSPTYIANIKADGQILDYSIPIVTVSQKNSEKTAMENFQQFYKALLMASFEGMAEISDEQKQGFEALDDFSSDDANNPCQLKITILMTDLVGNSRHVVYRFYRYSERKSYITVELLTEGEDSSSTQAYGSFYVLHSFAEKIIEDAKRVVDGIEVDATSKY
ncbi:MAG: DUF4340 domain-containing protein [Ruminococcaceae bacterium]|nr:DUF4340 domain-containing protein [Oscillospiraceae bacterium]